jgi:hypothetical protein
MNKIAFILGFLALFLFACDEEKGDPRNKYVGHYVGLAVPFAWNNVPNADGQHAELTLSKNQYIDNALKVSCETHPPIVGSTNFNTNSFGNFNTDDDPEFEMNRLYVSDDGLLYRKNMFYEDLYFTKFCRFVEPDSIYCLIYFMYDPSIEYFIKAKKTD